MCVLLLLVRLFVRPIVMEQQPDAVHAYGLDAVRNPLQLFEKFPILENVASATPMGTAVWRHKMLQALHATLIAQFRGRYGDPRK